MKTIVLPVFVAIIAGLCFTQSFAQGLRGHWQLIASDPYPDSVTHVVAGPGDLVYMATSDAGIFKSTDDGENWQTINAGIYDPFDITMLAIGPNGTLLAKSNNGGIYYSADGSRWEADGAISTLYPGSVVSAFAFDSHGTPYAGTIGAGIYRRNSLGTWLQIVPPATMPGVRYMLFDTGDRLLVSYDKLYRFSQDFSSIERTWDSATGPMYRSTWGDLLLAAQDSLYDIGDDLHAISHTLTQSLVVDSSGNLYAFGFGVYPWRSTDRGVSWNEYKYSNGHEYNALDHYSSHIEATSYGFISGGDRQISVSYDSGQTFRRFFELDAQLPVFVQVDPNGNLQAIDMSGSNDYNGGIWSSTDHGTTWRRRMPKQNILGMPLEDGNYYSTANYYSTTWPPQVSYDGGLTYRPINVPQGPDQHLYVSPNGTLWIDYGSAHFLRSTDSGSTWTEFAHFRDVPPAYFQTDSALSMGVVERGPNLWLATEGHVHFTSDNGQTWSSDSASYIFNSFITGGRGPTMITHTSGEGLHWLSPAENPDSGWLEFNGSYAADTHGNMLQFITSYENYATHKEVLLSESNSGVVLDTLCITPDTLDFSFNAYQDALVVDSAGNIFAASQTGKSGGLYRFIPAGASVGDAAPESSNVVVTLENTTLHVLSHSFIRAVTLYDVTGRSILASRANAPALSLSMAGVERGIYFVKVATAAGTQVKKIALLP